MDFNFTLLTDFAPPGKFLFRTGNKFITLTRQNKQLLLTQLQEQTLAQLDIQGEVQGSGPSFVESIVNNGILTVYSIHSREWHELNDPNRPRDPRTRAFQRFRRRRGSFFPYSHTFEDDIDLSRYQIYSQTAVQTDETACLIYTLQLLNCPEEILDHFKRVIASTSRTISSYRLRELCRRFKINITVYQMRKDKHIYRKNKIVYPSTKETYSQNYEICLVFDHYFVYDKDTGISSYALKYPDEAKRKASRFGVPWYAVKQRSRDKYMDSFNLVKLLLTHEQSDLQPESSDDDFEEKGDNDPERHRGRLLWLKELSRHQETVRLRNYLAMKRTYPDLTITEEDVAPYGLRPGPDETVGEKMDRMEELRQKRQERGPQQEAWLKKRRKMIFAFDFETCTDGQFHKSYMCCVQRVMPPQFEVELEQLQLESKEHQVYTFYGEHAGKQMLQHVTTEWAAEKDEYRAGVMLIAHNAGYDMRFIFNYFSDIVSPQLIRGGLGNLKQLKANYIYNYRIFLKEQKRNHRKRHAADNDDDDEDSGQFLIGYKSKSNCWITVHDSLNFTMCPLSKFPKMFDLGEIVKEIMPYDAYTVALFSQDHDDPRYGMRPLADLKQMLYDKIKQKPKNVYAARTGAQGCVQQDIKQAANDYVSQFEANAQEWGCIHEFTGVKYVDLIKYAKVYCERDVEILAKGYCKLRHMFHSVSNGLNIDDCVSVNQLTNKALQNYGCTTGVMELCGLVRDFIQQCVTGGKCMLRNNNKQFCNSQDTIADFDAVSLYPSAMAEMPGLLRGHPKVIPDEWTVKDLEEATEDGNKGAWFAEITVLEVGKEWQMPICNYYDHEENKRFFTNDMVGRTMWCSSVTVQDMMKMQDVKVKIEKGYYFDEGYNVKIKDFITNIFNERLKMKAQKNPMQLVYKLMMNGAYGRLILKPIETECKFVSRTKCFDRYLNREWNMIKSFEVLPPECPFSVCVDMYKEVHRHWSAPHLGVMILDYSKRIMNRLHNIAYKLDIPIFYMDTDSMHLLDNDVKRMAEEFSREYPDINEGKLIGKKLGQFHNDFEIKPVGPVKLPKFDDKKIRSSAFIGFGKKCYIHCLFAPIEDDSKEEEAKTVYGHSIAMKGFTEDSIYDTCNKFGITLPELYENLYNGEQYKANLLAGGRVSFAYDRQMHVSSRTEMWRTMRCILE